MFEVIIIVDQMKLLALEELYKVLKGTCIPIKILCFKMVHTFIVNTIVSHQLTKYYYKWL